MVDSDAADAVLVHANTRLEKVPLQSGNNLQPGSKVWVRWGAWVAGRQPAARCG